MSRPCTDLCWCIVPGEYLNSIDEAGHVMNGIDKVYIITSDYKAHVVNHNPVGSINFELSAKLARHHIA